MSFFLCFSISNYATVAWKTHTESLFEPIFLKALNMMDERGRNEVTSPGSSYKLRNTESIRHLTSLFSSTSLIGQFIRHLQITRDPTSVPERNYYISQNDPFTVWPAR